VLTVELERLGLGPGMRVLDVGCGQGRHVRATRLVPGVTGIALDLGREEVHGTRESLRALDALAPEQGGTVPGAGPWGVLRASGYRIPFSAESFDCVIVSEVLEHLDDDAAALAEVSRVLRPGGLLAVSVPRTGPEAVCWALSARYRNSPGGHVRIYRRSQLERLVQSRGYRIVGRHFAHALHSPFWWLRCTLGLDNDAAWPIELYHRFLVWDMMRRPLLTRALEAALNPFIGKSFVLYAVKH
jgi:SAM-dependent methyltransferase